MIRIIANPIAGGGRARRAAPALAEALRARGQEAVVDFTERAGDARRLADGIQAATAFIAVGGDGTLNEVLNGMRDPSTPLGVLPMGTANVLACELKLPREPEAAADLIAAGTTTPAVIGRADGRRFLLFTGVGMDAAIVHRLEQVRTGTSSKLKWAGPILRTIARWPRHRLRVETDDGTAFAGLTEVLVTRVRNYGGVMRMPDGIDIGDGLLHALCFSQRGRWGYARASVRALTSRLRLDRDLVDLRCRALRIESENGEPAHYQCDGDYGGIAPVTIDLEPRSANLIAPL